MDIESIVKLLYGKHLVGCQFREWECSQPECGETHSFPCTCGLPKALESYATSQREMRDETKWALAYILTACEQRFQSMGALTMGDAIEAAKKALGEPHREVYETFLTATPREREMQKGLEKLRELSEKATPGEWRSSSLAHLYLIADNEPSPICSMGEYQADGMVDGEFENWKANTAFIIGAVNFVRSAILEGKV